MSSRSDTPQMSLLPTTPTASSTLPTDFEERRFLQPEGEARDPLYERLEMRLAALERRFQGSKLRANTTVNLRNSSEAEQEETFRKELIAEVDKRHQDALKDIQSYMESIAQSLRTSSPAHPPPPVDLSDYLTAKDLDPLKNRLRVLESILPNRAAAVTVTATSTPANEEMRSLYGQLNSLKMAMETHSKQEKYLLETQSEVKSLRTQLLSLEDSLLQVRSNFEALRKERDLEAKAGGGSPPHRTQSSLPQGITSKQILADISTLMSTERGRALSVTQTPALNANSEQIQTLEVGLKTLRHELEKMRGEMGARDKEIDEMNEHFGRMDRMFSGAVQRVQAEVMQKMESIEEILDRPADNPDALKNLSALRNVIMKLQRDFRSLSGTVKTQQSSSPRLEDLVSSPTVTTESTNPIESRLKAMTSYIQKHDQLLKDQEITLHQVINDMDSMSLYLKNNLDAQRIARLSDMEKFKGEMDAVMRKVTDGIKLNQRDYEKIEELYEQLDKKGDKAELTRKVDKEELKKAYLALSRKINSCREEVRRTVVTPPPPSVPREEAAVRIKKFEFGCLSCGADVSSPEPTTESSPGFPSYRGLQKYGHGFSKLLPILSDLVSPVHKRGTSDLNRLGTERHKPMNRREVETANYTHRLQNETPPYPLP